MSSPIQTQNPKESYPKATYSHVVTVDAPARLIYTAGQVGRDNTGFIPESYEEQVKLAYQNLGHCLAAVNASPKDIVKLTYYVVNYDPNRPAHIEITEDFLDGHRPGITLVPVQQLAAPGFLFEVEAVAAIEPDRQPTDNKSKRSSD
jgi:monoamine oxidase